MSMLLDCEKVTIKFGGLTAVSELDLRIGEQELVGLIGPNGAGKTTAFNLINLRFSRDEEAAADAAAAVTLDQARVSRRGLYDFFQRLRAETDAVPAWLSNHPTSESRARLLGTGTEQDMAASPSLTEEEFEALQAACRE